MNHLTICLLLFGVGFTPVFSFVVSSPTSCEYYDAACVEKAAASNGAQDISQCYGTKVCPRDAVHDCYAVWMNANATNGEHAHKSGLGVKRMGCFPASGSCGQTQCSGELRGGHLFCCCQGDMCNSEFEFVPELTPESPETEIKTPKPTNPETKESDFIPVIYVLVPLISVLVAIGAVIFVVKRRKVARFAENAANMEEIGALVGNDMSPAHLNMQQRDIQLIEIKARGRFGAVWKGKFGFDMVAVKIFPLQDKNSWYAEQEIYNLPQMNHDNILKFIGVEKRGENLQTEFWLITSFHERGSLCDFLKSNVVTWEELCKIALTMARGLAHLHEELQKTGRQEMKPAVAHRDFKSKNVLIKSDMTACIADFGLALVFEPGKAVGDAHGQVGTRRYMAPEVLEGAINFSKDAFLRIDVYACGLVLWELASRCVLRPQPGNLIIQNNNESNALTTSHLDEYKLPFEKEIASPTLDEMQKQVVNQKLRPRVKDSWLLHPGMATFCNTFQECWDHDAEARLSASCVLERIKSLQQYLPNRLVTEEQHLNTLNQTESGSDVITSVMGADNTEMTPLYIQSPSRSATTETNCSTTNV